ncbi:hypothetical protein [Dankookia rubra]|nr:hypothetical protein [Dankookia rubra]
MGRFLRLLFGRRRYQRRWGRIAAAAVLAADRATAELARTNPGRAARASA